MNMKLIGWKWGYTTISGEVVADDSLHFNNISVGIYAEPSTPEIKKGLIDALIHYGNACSDSFVCKECGLLLVKT